MAEWREKMTALEDAAARPDRRRSTSCGVHRPSRADDAILMLRLGHDRHVGGAALRHPRGPRVLPVRATWPRWRRACRTRSRMQRAYPGPAVHRVRRRRRVRDADGRVPHRHPPRAADQGVHQQQRRVRPDPVGADGARLSRSSAFGTPSTAGLRRVRAGQRRARASASSKPGDVEPPSREALAYPARRWSTC